MKRRTKIRLGLILGVISTLSLISQFTKSPWLIYHKPSFSGQVIDIETKIPIEGAVVEASYYSAPIFVPGTGGSPDAFKIKETLTDREGKFHFSPYVSLINPFSREAHVDVSIYKPGYLPGGAMLRELSTPDNRQHLWYSGVNLHKRIKIHDGIVEIPKAENLEERRKAIPSTEFEVSLSQQQDLLKKMINEEISYLNHPTMRYTEDPPTARIGKVK